MILRVLLAIGMAGVFGAVFDAEAGAQQRHGPKLTPRVAGKHRSGPLPSIRADVGLILVPVTVTNPFGAPFSGLTNDSFRVFEDGAEQEVKYFSSEDAPVSLGIVFDASRSMEGKLEQSRAAVTQLFQTAMPNDEFFLVEFNDTPRVLCNFTRDPELIEKAVVGITPRNWTALFDAVYMALQQMKAASNSRRMLFVLSDGGDNNSRYTEGEMKAYVREADVGIYSIGLGGLGLIQRHIRLLRQLAEETGGQYHQVNKMSDLPEAVEKISATIRHQYILGYSSNNARNDGRYRKIEVRVNQRPDLPRLRASWRTGYYAPDGE